VSATPTASHAPAASITSAATKERSPGRPARGRRARFLPIALVIAIGLQVPIIWALARLTGHLVPILGLTAVLTGAFIFSFVGPRAIWAAPGKARLYLVVWPFFMWWTVALLFALIAPLALGARAILQGALPAIFPVFFRAAPRLSTDATLTAAVVAAALGTAIALYQRPRLRARDVFIADLPAAFDGYRIAQISDLHCGPFASAGRVAGWVAAVNRLKADLIVATGDFIANGSAFVPVVADALGKLAARDGVFASMGNHDYFTDGDALARALDRAGLTVLRNDGVEVRRDGAVLYLAGVDDTWTRRHDMGRALADRPPGAPVVLLAHDPALFPEAVRRGVDLTLSGHTHGGQLGVPLLSRKLNLARIMTPFSSGLYRSGASTLYVNRGLGTTGPPVRVGVPPEIAIVTLRGAPSS
jgi:predicted MPP superfamily phosphohydrolase